MTRAERLARAEFALMRAEEALHEARDTERKTELARCGLAIAEAWRVLANDTRQEKPEYSG
jgi:hypothetical protein